MDTAEVKRIAHDPINFPEEWEGDMYMGDDGYTMHLDAGGAFDDYFEREAMKKENMKNLPEMAFAFVQSNAPGKYVVAIKRGEKGCFQTTYDETDPVKAKQLVEHLNTKKLHITTAQAEAMLFGSMFGWDAPGAQVATQERIQKPLITVSALYNGDGIKTHIREGDELTDGLKWEDENGFTVNVDSIGNLTGIVMDSYKELIETAFEDEPSDRLHALTELNPEIPKMPGLKANGKPTAELIEWMSNPKVFHYLKRVEEAMPDLLDAANQFVNYAQDQEVCDRLCGTVSSKVITEEALNESFKVATSLAGFKEHHSWIKPNDGHDYTGKIISESAHHVVQHLGRNAIIYEKRNLNPIPHKGQDVLVNYNNGKGQVTVHEKQKEQEVCR